MAMPVTANLFHKGAFVFNTVDRESVLIPPMTPAMEKLSLEMHAGSGVRSFR
jgi:hypothetical protein